MLFKQRSHAGIVDGSITVTFRRSKRRQAVAGRRYRTGAGIIEVEAVDIVEPEAITPADARRAGYPSVAELLADLPAGLSGAEDPVYRIRFHHVDAPDPRDELAATEALSADEIAALDARLDRLDRAGASGPWTQATLTAIAERPGFRAGDLAAALGREREPFKIDVRKLKHLGLTISLEVGYRLSPRGETYLGKTTRT